MRAPVLEVRRVVGPTKPIGRQSSHNWTNSSGIVCDSHWLGPKPGSGSPRSPQVPHGVEHRHSHGR
jgi:hypothetical protein